MKKNQGKRAEHLRWPKMLGLLVILVIAWPCLGLAQTTQTPPPLEIKQVRANVYEVTGGSGANTGFIIGEKGVIVVDAKMTADSAREMLTAVSKVSSLPLQAIILTHSDGDHVNGLIGWPKEIPVIAHENTFQEMKGTIKEGPLLDYFPSITYKQELIIRSGKTAVHLLYFGPGHTSGDTVVYLPEEKVAFLGDLVFIGREPLIHRQKGGNSFGVVKILKQVLQLEATSFIHGHGEVIDRSGVEKAISELEARQAQVKTLLAQGKSLEEIKAALNVQEAPVAPGRTRRPSLVEIIYLELTEKK